MQALAEGPTLQVQKFEFSGNQAIDSVSLQALLSDAVGQAWTLPELENLARRITLHYRSQGHFVARAYIPAQEIVAGVVRIQVVEGRYGAFHLHNASRVDDAVLQAFLAPLGHEGTVSLTPLEHALHLIQETPGVRVMGADVSPGQAVGSSDVTLKLAATPALSGSVLWDNYGSAYTGPNRLSFNADVHSPSGQGDRVSLGGLGTMSGNLLNARTAYSTLLGSHGLRGELGLGRTQYTLGGTYSALDAKGTADVVDATFSYPLRRVQAQAVDITLNLSHKKLEDRIMSTSTVTPKEANTVTASLQWRDEDRWLETGGSTQVSAALTLGELTLNSASALAADAVGTNTAGHFGKAVFSLSRVSLLPENFRLSGSLKLQQVLNHKNLDSSERMPVGGSIGVMGYPSGELTGSNAALVRLELSRALPAWTANWEHSGSLFTNWGQASAATPLSASDARRRISDVGVGWQANHRGWMLKAQLAHGMSGTAQSEPYPRHKLLLQAGMTF